VPFIVKNFFTATMLGWTTRAIRRASSRNENTPSLNIFWSLGERARTVELETRMASSAGRYSLIATASSSWLVSLAR